MRNNKGFTLIEILAVVVILGIVILISTNYVLKHVRSSIRDAFTTDVEQFIKSASYDSLVKDKIEEYVVYYFPNSGIDILPKEADAGFMIKDDDDKVRIQVWHNELGLCALKSYTDSKVYIDDSIKSKEDCVSFLHDIKDGEEISVKSLTNEDVDYKLKSSCYTLDSEGKITNFNTNECGTVLVIPNKINGEYVNGISDSFVQNAPKTFTSFYMAGVKNITELPLSFLKDNTNLQRIIITDMPNLQVIKAHFANNDVNLTTFYLTKCPNLTALSSEDPSPDIVGTFGILTPVSRKLRSITLEDLPKLQNFYASFQYHGAKTLNISNFDSLTVLLNSAFANSDGDTDVTISNNKNLERITNGPFSASNLKSLKIFNNEKLTIITDGALMGKTGTRSYIDELLMYNNPELETLQNSAFQNYEFKTIKLYNMPKLKNIRYGAFSTIIAEEVDLSGLELEVFDFSAWGGAKIDKLILPPTITSFNYGTAANFNSIVNDSIEFGGSDKCSLINLFRTSNGDGTYTYLVDKDKLPDCP